MKDEFCLVIPATQPMMCVSRMALSGFCCQYGADMGTVEDIRMLSDEACYCLIHQGQRARALTIRAWMEGALMHIRFEAERVPGEAAEAPPHDPEIARGILCTLATEVRIQTEKDAMLAIEVEVNLQV